jgi:TfoX/Sxy family transcriptional regulator of competence genes
MALNEQLAERIRKELKRQTGMTEKKMFGGVAFLIHGNMSVGIHGDELIVRISPEETDELLKQPGVRLFDLTGRPMKGWLLAGSVAIKQQKSLSKWIRRGVEYAASLPKK